ncbi:metal ABC transporter substrate-binding protein [Meiothermus ruber]|nr:metal ABC transporter substrate-binding protein [Meiothermus ruber]AGK04964.1 periplasmic solute binding protein [Meiothermus ruber DSM 1279]MCL6530357.1 metal ABC transporter substrate-binding protein [Meiothermus ruber]
MQRWFAFIVLSGLALGQPLQVAATTTVIADLVREVGGPRVRVVTVVPMGADPHSFEPRPSTVQALARARVLFANGMNLEVFLDRIAAQLPRNAQVVRLAEGLPNPICYTQADREAPGAHLHGPCDPHLWLDPSYGLAYAERIRDALTRLDPAGRSLYEARLADFRARVQAADAKVRACLARTPPASRKAVVQHDAYRYAGRHYGIEFVGSIASFSGQQQGARALANLALAMRERGVQVIFTEPQFAQTAARALAEATGARVFTLYSDTLTPQVASYLALIQHNGQTLCQAFR